ncbi:hypothetical protein OF83DRAFT_1080814 [Amylostereum chailletii]|nr:hypothetical protein OF83DRAFT_1080814 [Amylostereum chailletii]
MDSWIPNNISQPADSNKTKAKGDNVPSKSSQYPVLEAGQVTAATLERRNEVLEWKPLAGKSDGRKLAIAEGITRSSSAFPATRSPPLLSMKVSQKQRAEQGAHFLRTCYPDVDIPSELIRDQIVEDFQSRLMNEDFNPYRGHLMDVIYYDRGPQKRFAFVAFPVGETGSDLNISEVKFSHDGRQLGGQVASPSKLSRRPSNKSWHFLRRRHGQASAVSSQSPRGSYIHEIVAEYNLVVRTMTSAGVYEVDISPPQSARHPSKIALSEISNFNRAHVGDRWISDVIVTHSLGHSILLNDQGDIFRGVRGSFDLTKSPSNENTLNDGFWRLSTTTHDDICAVISTRTMSKVDFRSPEPRSPVYQLTQSKELLTSIECTPGHALRLVTTRELLWIDERFEKRPLLAYRHHRQFDRTLQTNTFEYRDKTFTLLSSLHNNLMTIYDVSRGEEQLIQVGHEPYSLTFGPPGSHDGYRILRQPFDIGQVHIPLLQLSRRGEIQQTSLALSSIDTVDAEAISKVVLDVHWSQKIQDFDQAGRVTQPYTGSLGEREHREVDLRPPYSRILMPLLSDMSSTGDEVFDTLDKMPRFWQEMDASSEDMFTTYDVAFRSGDEPQHQSRADFLTRSALNGARGYRAFFQNRIPYDGVKKYASWHFNLKDFLGRHIPEIPDDLHNLADRLHVFDLKDDDRRSGLSLRRETEAREQLVLDIALSSDVFSYQRLGRRIREESPESVFDDMSRAAEAMSLHDPEPPTVKFGFFNPTPKADHYQPIADVTGERTDDAQQPLGVRLLLQEWDLGGDPESYLFVDPYATDQLETSMPSGTLTTGQGRANMLKTPATQSQQPPRIIAASQIIPSVLPSIPNSQPRSVGGMRVGVFSQDVGIHPLHGDPSLNMASQPFGQHSQPPPMPMASTQIVPGPFGGRQPITKKKQVKKRVWGF